LMAPQLTALYFSTNGHNSDGMGTTQNLVDAKIVERVKIYPQDYFSPVTPLGLDQGMRLSINGLSSRTSLCHHFACSWHDDASPYSPRANSFRQAGNVLLANLVNSHLEASSTKRLGAGARLPYSYTHPAVRSEIGRKTDAGLLIDGQRAGTGIYGPYVDLPAGRYIASVILAPNTERSGTAYIDVTYGGGAMRLAERRIEEISASDESFSIPFVAAEAIRDVEIRLFCALDCKVTIDRVEFEAI